LAKTFKHFSHPHSLSAEPIDAPTTNTRPSYQD
jgi:hypothetical protein